ncbi:MAG: ABC transporter ATP-binding protein [Brachybacterium tyrofermentans]
MSTMTNPPRTDDASSVATPAAIDAVQISKYFAVDGRELPILHEVSLQVPTNELVAIMGPSGSGKSTLLYCLAGLEKPSSGGVRLNGIELGRQSRTALAKMRRHAIGFVFQSYNLIPTLPAYENVAPPYLLAGHKPPRDELLEVIDHVGLAHRVNARPPSMSGGEQQRTALARVLSQQPQIVFADEPTGALDSRSGELVLSRLTDISRQPGRTVLLVTHDPAVAAHCDRVLFLADGRLVDELRPRSVSEVADTLARLSTESQEV